ncbi:MAG: hypothetical protein IE911_14190 [Brevundimonas sp.]|nr:hypothetical protein [Brevundimonas sp.]
MRRFLLTTVLLGAGLLPGVALAQQAPTNGAGLRYLSWPGKSAVAARATAPAPAPASFSRRLLRLKLRDLFVDLLGARLPLDVPPGRTRLAFNRREITP